MKAVELSRVTRELILSTVAQTVSQSLLFMPLKVNGCDSIR